ncbi:hypothetical protein NQZ68_003995 [Dissostichus eleginoides]|nr:hypothetical protein NQZ68_003995 [Dissostichus eleginoides]
MYSRESGITLGNATEMENQTICAIHDYLNHHLPPIVKNLSMDQNSILKGTTTFLSQPKDLDMNRTIQCMQTDIRKTLTDLAPVLPKTPCHSMNITWLVELEQPLTAHRLSLLRCYMQNISAMAPHLSRDLGMISQQTMVMEDLMSKSVPQRNCSLPAMDILEASRNVKCLLECLDEQLSKLRPREVEDLWKTWSLLSGCKVN